MSVKAGIEYPFSSNPATPGTIYPVEFSGQRTTAIAPGEFALSDVVSGLSLSAGAVFGIRNYYSGTGSPGFPHGIGALGTPEGVVNGSDLVDSGTITASGGYAYTPCSILGITDTYAPPSLLYFGDSIAFGAYEDDYGDALGDTGWVMRAINALATPIPFVRMAFQGHSLQQEANSSARVYRSQLWGSCKHVLFLLGANDFFINQGGTFANTTTPLLAMVAEVIAAGANPWLATVLPISTSTDSWATTGNQTSTNHEAARLAFNAWVRDEESRLADGIAGFFELADVCESTRDSGKWAVVGGTNALGTSIASALTGDGVHPSAYGHTLLAAAQDFGRFT